MSKKRSIGVTIFGWWYIIAGALGLLNLPIILVIKSMSSGFPYMRSAFMEQFMGPFYILYVLAVTIASLIAGIGLLKLKPWARKLVIIICLVGMVYSIFVSGQILMHSSEFVEMSIPSSELSKGVSPAMIEATKSFTQAIMIVSMIIGTLFGLGFVIFIIWFFNRKSVIEQFQPYDKTIPVQEQIR